MTNNGYAGSTVLFAFLAGAASGAVVALLLAPRSGAETRASLMELGSDVARAASNVPTAVRNVYDSASSAAVTAYNQALSNAPTNREV